MSNDNVIQINPNAPIPTQALSDERIEVHMRAWSEGVAADDYLAVITALNAYNADLEAVEEDLGIVSIPAYIEMLGMLKGTGQPSLYRVVYSPAKGWYDAGKDRENIGK